MRDGYHLTEGAQIEREDFQEHYGEGSCACHLNPPCGSCVHPGNPLNQAEDDSAWEPDDPLYPGLTSDVKPGDPLYHMMYVGNRTALQGLIQYTEEERRILLEEAHAAIRESRPFNVDVLSSTRVLGEEELRWTHNPDPIEFHRMKTTMSREEEEMCAPLHDRPNPRQVPQHEVLRRRKARKVAEASQRRNRR
jgi:hypothetical protein